MTPRVFLAMKLLKTVTYPVGFCSEARTAIAPSFVSLWVGKGFWGTCDKIYILKLLKFKLIKVKV